MRNTLVNGAGGLVASALLLLATAACGSGGGGETSAATTPPAYVASGYGSSGIPTPNPTDEPALIAAIVRAAPGTNALKAVDRARNTCSQILGGTAPDRLISSTVIRFSDSVVDVTEDQAAKIVATVKAQPWCT